MTEQLKTESYTKTAWQYYPIKVSGKYILARALSLYLPIFLLILIIFILLVLLLPSFTWFLLFLIVDLIFILLLSYETLHWTNTRYVIEANHYDKLLDQVKVSPGNIIIETGAFNKVVNVHSTETFQAARVYKTFIERQFNLGTVILQGTTEVRLAGVANPEVLLLVIQQQLDDLKGDLVHISEQLEIHKQG